jgi:hypothetical protein
MVGAGNIECAESLCFVRPAAVLKCRWQFSWPQGSCRALWSRRCRPCGIKQVKSRMLMKKMMI